MHLSGFWLDQASSLERLVQWVHESQTRKRENGYGRHVLEHLDGIEETRRLLGENSKKEEKAFKYNHV